MGTLYLIDGHNAVLADSEINDTIPLETGDFQLINGSFVIRVPFGVPIDGTPSNLAELEVQKFTGLLSFYPGFPYIDYDDGIDATGWDTALSQGVRLGERMTTSIADLGVLTSTMIALTGPAPANALIDWEVFATTRPADPDGDVDDPKNGIFSRRYVEITASDLTCEVSFDNGANWNTVTDGVLFPIPLADQGTQFKIRFTNNVSGARRWMGSWAALY